MMLGEFRTIILENRVVYTGTEAENVALDQLWVNLLRLGLFDETLDFDQASQFAASP